MSISAETVAPAALPAVAERGEPPVWSIVLIFWGAIAAALAAARVVQPSIFERQDPDSMMRLVQVRDLLGGQAWFDLMQHRLDPPNGLLMHWSRLIDAPLAALTLVGGEAFALTAWPLLLFLVLIGGCAYAATALGGRAATVPAIVLPPLFVGLLLSFLPNSIDHHNAQLGLLVATLACAVHMRRRPALGAAAGVLCGVMLAIGLEMLPYVAVFGTVIALQWAARADSGKAAALFGFGFGVAPAALFFLAGSPLAPFACDSVSWTYAITAAVAGFGLAGATRFFEQDGGFVARCGALALLAFACGAAVLLVSPECLSGPFAKLSPELKAAWLATVTEAQPVYIYSMREPAGIIAVLGPPVVAFAVAVRRAWQGRGLTAWAFPAALVAVAIAMGFYQVRTLPYANAVAVPILAAWIAELLAERRAERSTASVLALVAAVLLSLPIVHLAIGEGAVAGLSVATEGRRVPLKRMEAPAEQTAGMSVSEKDCSDRASAALLAKVPDGILLTPVFYGSTALAISGHAVVAAPYHRAGAAILDAIHAVQRPPEEARRIVRARKADYVALCTTTRESITTAARAPDGLLAQLLAGERVSWLEPLPADAPTALRLWRVVE
jgi:hypothetical protein